MPNKPKTRTASRDHGTGPLDRARWDFVDRVVRSKCFDRGGQRYDLEVSTWAHKGVGFGLDLYARNPDDRRVRYNIVLRHAYRDIWLYDLFAPEPSQPRLPPFKWSDTRQAFMDACKRAIFYCRVAGPDAVLIEARKPQADLLIEWCEKDEDGQPVSTPLVLPPDPAWQTDLVACAEKLALRHLRSMELCSQSLDEIVDATFAPPNVVRRAAKNLLETRAARETTGETAYSRMRFEITVAGKERLKDMDAASGEPKHFGF